MLNDLETEALKLIKNFIYFILHYYFINIDFARVFEFTKN